MKYASAIDFPQLRIVTEGDEALERELIALYCTLAEDCLSRMAGLVGAPGEGWGRVAHELKGASANLRALQMTDLCKEAETFEGRDERERMLAAIRAELQRIKAVLPQ